MTSASRRCSAARGFTLIEILVAVLVIVILMGIVITVGARVVSGQRESQTTGVLRTLDRALEEYFTDAEAFPKFSLNTYENVQGRTQHPEDIGKYVDPEVQTFEDGNDYPTRPSAAVFIEQVRGFGAVDELIEAIPDRYIGSLVRPMQAEDRTGTTYVRIVDAWDNEILYVHPDNALAQALFGECINSRPYFLSAGPDGKFGFADEVPPGSLDPLEDAYIQLVMDVMADNLTSVPTKPPLMDASQQRTKELYQEFRR